MLSTARARRSAFLLLALASFAGRALAADWYVDAQNGSDANTGDAPAAARKSISFALGAIPTGGVETLHVAPGLYDAANGENFPLALRTGLSVVGAGAASTIVDADLAVDAFRIEVAPTINSGGITSTTVLAGLTIRDAATGVWISSSWNQCSPLVHDLVVRDCVRGIHVHVGSSIGVGVALPTIERVRLEANATGLFYQGFASTFGGSAGSLTLRDSTIVGSVLDGIELSFANKSGWLIAERCRIDANGGDGIRGNGGMSLQGASPIFLTMRDSLVARNAGRGVYLSVHPTNVNDASIRGSTFVSNGTVGLVHTFAGSKSAFLDLANTIFWNHPDDLDVTPAAEVRRCDIGDGDFAGQNGNFSADPLFANPATGDFRLRFGSPCAEVALAGDSSALDLLGNPRPLDGDLDTVRAPDVGAYELETLHRIGTPALGQQFGFEFWGATGSTSNLLLARAPLTGGQSTPFGELYLDTSVIVDLGVVQAKPGPPFVLRRVMPSNPALVGTTFSFQALTDSAAAPQGKAYTNPTTFVVLP
jgi:hypothetical protein